jgi:exodeoxyribonuclease VII large subunit
VERVVAQAYQQGVWTRVEVVNVNLNGRNGHVYLELSERDEAGNVIAQARGTIWARTAERILPVFERDTGAQLAPGIKLLVLAKPVFKAQYGLSIDITEIDASYTVGDLEANKRKIRERLKAESLFDQNKRLPPPWDFNRVLVVAPQGAAGLGDFAAEADRLQSLRVCEFLYVHSRFQGAGAAAEILSAAQEGLQAEDIAHLDALIIIRGGGAVNDLAWLNDYDLARFVCTCPVPVLTGIGHERDSTLLDEVAHKSFDTPSKVIAGIERQIALRARDAKAAYQDVQIHVRRAIELAAASAERLNSEIRLNAGATLGDARAEVESAMNQIRIESHLQVQKGRHGSLQMLSEVKGGARQHLMQASLRVPAAMSSIEELSRAVLRQTKGELRTLVSTAVLGKAASQVRSARVDVHSTKDVLLERAGQAVRMSRANTDALVREVTGQGPKKTLARGFAVVKQKNGKTVTSVSAARQAGLMELTFKDGSVHATVQEPKYRGVSDDE